MRVTIELKAGPYGDDFVTKEVIQKNIDTLQRFIDGKQRCYDATILNDTKSILEAIKRQLPEGSR